MSGLVEMVPHVQGLYHQAVDALQLGFGMVGGKMALGAVMTSQSTGDKTKLISGVGFGSLMASPSFVDWPALLSGSHGISLSTLASLPL